MGIEEKRGDEGKMTTSEFAGKLGKCFIREGLRVFGPCVEKSGKLNCCGCPRVSPSDWEGV